METLSSGKNNKNEKVPKGYRLKISTHNKIKELQVLTNGSQDAVISRALRYYTRKLNSK
jgi:hypothetical protein